MDATLRQGGVPALRVTEVRVAAVDQDIARLQVGPISSMTASVAAPAWTMLMRTRG